MADCNSNHPESLNGGLSVTKAKIHTKYSSLGKGCQLRRLLGKTTTTSVTPSTARTSWCSKEGAMIAPGTTWTANGQARHGSMSKQRLYPERAHAQGWNWSAARPGSKRPREGRTGPSRSTRAAKEASSARAGPRRAHAPKQSKRH